MNSKENVSFIYLFLDLLVLLKRETSPKNYTSVVILLSSKLFQTCVTFFLLLSTKEDILKNVGNQTVDGSHWLP